MKKGTYYAESWDFKQQSTKLNCAEQQTAAGWKRFISTWLGNDFQTMQKKQMPNLSSRLYKA